MPWSTGLIMCSHVYSIFEEAEEDQSSFTEWDDLKRAIFKFRIRISFHSVVLSRGCRISSSWRLKELLSVQSSPFLHLHTSHTVPPGCLKLLLQPAQSEDAPWPLPLTLLRAKWTRLTNKDMLIWGKPFISRGLNKLEMWLWWTKISYICYWPRFFLVTKPSFSIYLIVTFMLWSSSIKQ